MDTPEWLARARPVDSPGLEVGFIVWPDFYHWPENDFSAEEWRRLREPLYQPAVEMHGRVNHVFTNVLEASLGELVRHYRDVLRLSARHARPLARSHFWLTPFLLSPGDLEIHFAYHETREDAEGLFQALETPGDGEIYWDVDQGWELEVFASGDRLFVRHADFETQEERDCISCDRDSLVRQVAPLRARLNRILAELESALGADYWSRDSSSGSAETGGSA